MTQLREYISQLKRLTAHRSYKRLLLGGAISSLGDRIGYIAFLAAVTHDSNDVLAVSGITVAEMLPPIIAVPIVSLIVDRFDKRKLMFWSDIARAIFFTLAVVFPHIWVFYVTAFLSAAFTVLFEPSRQALEPHYVPDGEITQANGIRMSLMSVVMVLGPSIGGLLAGTLGFQWAFAINALSFLASAFLVSDLDKVPSNRKSRTVSAWEEISGGFKLVRNNPNLTYLFLLFGAFIFAVGIQFPLIYVFVDEQLHGGPNEAGWLFSAIGVGGLAGGAWLASLRKETKPFDLATLHGRRNMALLVAIDGAVVLMFTWQTTLLPTMLFFACFGFLGTSLHTGLQSAIATECPDGMRGRVFALHSAMHGPLIVLSIAIGAPLAKAYGSVAVFNVTAVLEVLLGGLGWIFARHNIAQSAQATTANGMAMQTLRSPDRE